MHWDTLKQDNYSTVRGDGGGRVGEVRAGTTSPMPEPVFQCSFEEDGAELCGRSQYAYDDFDWTVNSGNTPSKDTGPQAAKDGKNYLYIEASKPRTRGDAAV